MELRWRCTDCEEIVPQVSIETVRDPKPGSAREWSVCPHCRAADQWENVCDEPGCQLTATSGWPSEAGYRRTCPKHYRVPLPTPQEPTL